MAENCTLYISNLTEMELFTVSTGSYSYQMSYWSFPNIPRLTTISVAVEFSKQHSDEDDSAQQNYALGSSQNPAIIDVYATSDNQSAHYLSVGSLGASNPQYLVIAMCSGSTLLGAAGACEGAG